MQIHFQTQNLFQKTVNSMPKRAIVSLTIAATFISILRSHAMTDEAGAEPERFPVVRDRSVSLLVEISDAKADHVDGAGGPDWCSGGYGADG
jgi:hypothetical protein